MFDQEMERLDHEIDDALLFYYAAQSGAEKEALIFRAVEASLERLQHCLEELRAGRLTSVEYGRVRSYLSLSEEVLKEGLSKFVRVGDSRDEDYWQTLLSLAISLYADIDGVISEKSCEVC